MPVSIASQLATLREAAASPGCSEPVIFLSSLWGGGCRLPRGSGIT